MRRRPGRRAKWRGLGVSSVRSWERPVAAMTALAEPAAATEAYTADLEARATAWAERLEEAGFGRPFSPRGPAPRPPSRVPPSLLPRSGIGAGAGCDTAGINAWARFGCPLGTRTARSCRTDQLVVHPGSSCCPSGARKEVGCVSPGLARGYLPAPLRGGQPAKTWRMHHARLFRVRPISDSLVTPRSCHPHRPRGVRG
jgi:hypothetical protein